MAKFKALISSLNKDSESKIDVTCPNCGQVTSFVFKAEMPAKNIIKCKHCRRDLSNEFIALAVQAELKRQLELRKYLYMILAFSILILVLLIVWQYLYSANGLIITFLVLAAVFFGLALFFLIKTGQQIKAFRQIIEKYNLDKFI